MFEDKALADQAVIAVEKVVDHTITFDAAEKEATTSAENVDSKEAHVEDITADRRSAEKRV